MTYKLLFQIHGAPVDADEAVFETKLPTITTQMLMPVMGWQTANDALSSYLLTHQQACAIERLALVTLPKDLELYLSCHTV